MKSVLACLDFSPITTRVLKAAIAAATKANTRLTLLHVVQEFVPSDRRRLAVFAEQQLNELRRLFIKDTNRATIIVEKAVFSTPKAVLAVARRVKADLIVMGSHGYGPVERVLMGSTSQGVVHKSTCPVLIIPARKNRAAKSRPVTRVVKNRQR